MNWNDVVGFFVATFAILNPLGNLINFTTISEGVRPGVRRAMAALVALVVLAALLVALFAGKSILEFFGISMPAFRIAGGIIIFLMGLGMIRGKALVEMEVRPVEKGDDYSEAKAHLRAIMVPFIFPLFVGPGSISTVIPYSQEAATGWDWLGMTLALLGVALSIMVIFMFADPLSRILGENGMQITGRILGLLICAIGVQFILVGLSNVTTIFSPDKLVP